MERRIEEVKRDSEKYPGLLHFIKDAPETLYYSGDSDLANTRCFAVVGSRKPTAYGKWAAFKIGERLAEAGITVVSGMASGIDTLAHRGALSKDGKTIAVLGTGIDICFPAANKMLKAEIEEKGLVISEYPEGYRGGAFTFPMRNRIISGICEGVIVVEAALKSGSLITAGLAADQGRMVYALPGNINNVMSIGTNKLLRDGATPIAVVDDLLSDLGVSPKTNRTFAENLSDDELLVLKVIEGTSEVTLDAICGRLDMAPGKVTGIVTVLEMKGIVCSSLGKIFLAK